MQLKLCSNYRHRALARGRYLRSEFEHCPLLKMAMEHSSMLVFPCEPSYSDYICSSPYSSFCSKILQVLMRGYQLLYPP